VLDARTVALAGYRGMLRGTRVIVPGLGNWLFAQAVRFTPRRLATAVVRRIQETRGAAHPA
jgi:short-subunit dehydrogenase